jgi:hypothetical protein
MTTMPTPEFWHDLAFQFRALLVLPTIRADWVFNVGSLNLTGEWELVGMNRSEQLQFEALARRAASGLKNAVATDALVAWLEALKADGRRFQEGSSIFDGNGVLQRLTGSIYDVCEASADFCSKLESEASQVEFEERQRNDPKNWSALRQWYEAFKSIKELHAMPPERIPESLVRQTIAKQYGITPEQVTIDQIKFEVSGLLSSYPHIEVIPLAVEEASSASHVSEPKALRDAYLAMFADEKIKIRDLCWAAGQHYREWKRWLAGELKAGSTADLAFRRILTSGKRPLEFNKKPRPKGWE